MAGLADIACGDIHKNYLNVPGAGHYFDAPHRLPRGLGLVDRQYAPATGPLSYRSRVITAQASPGQIGHHQQGSAKQFGKCIHRVLKVLT